VQRKRRSEGSGRSSAYPPPSELTVDGRELGVNERFQAARMILCFRIISGAFVPPAFEAGDT
jgi:hypothetical protein